MNRKKSLFILLAVVVFVTTPFAVHAQQISPAHNTGTITVDTSDAYNSLNSFDNDNNGVIDITGTGTLTNNSGALLNNNAGGTLTNTGTLNNAASGPSPEITNYGTLTNYGSLFNTFYDSSGNFCTGSLTNYTGGTIDNFGGIISGTFYNYGAINSSGALNYYNHSTLYNYGTLNNSGMMNTNGPPANYPGGGYSLSGTLNNYGTLTNSGTMTNAYCILNNSGTLTNTGTLNNFSSFGGGGTLNNNLGGTLNNNNVLNNWYGGTLANNGALNNSGSLENAEGGTLTNTGALNNSGTLDNGNGGSLVNYGALTNSGRLSAVGGINPGSVVNYGILNNSGNIGIGNIGARLTNYGALINLVGGRLTTDMGGTFLNYGILINNYIMSQDGGINITGGSLGGTGTMTGDVTIGSRASVHPGNSPGTLTINGTFSSSGNLLFDIGGLNAGQYSVLQINGDAIFTGGNVEFDFITGYSAKPGDSWDLLFADSITGWDTLAFTLAGLGNGLSWEIDPFTNGERLLITVSPNAVVPIPPAFFLLGSGLLGLGALMRFRKG